MVAGGPPRRDSWLLRFAVAGSIDKREEVLSFLRFATVGGLGTVTDFGVLNLLLFAFAQPILLANTASVSAAILQNYYLHRYWTFANQEKNEVSSQLAKFAFPSMIGLGLSNLLLRPLVALWGHVIMEFMGPIASGELLSTNIGKLTSIGIVLIWNYTASRLWTFRS